MQLHLWHRCPGNLWGTVFGSGLFWCLSERWALLKMCFNTLCFSPWRSNNFPLQSKSSPASPGYLSVALTYTPMCYKTLLRAPSAIPMAGQSRCACQALLVLQVLLGASPPDHCQPARSLLCSWSPQADTRDQAHGRDIAQAPKPHSPPQLPGEDPD